MAKVKLNKEQKDLFNFIQKLPMEEKTTVILTGIAGSGKTTLISELYKNKGKYDEVIVSSLTGKAAQVLRSKDIKEARTIASFLNGKPRISIKYVDKKSLEKLRKNLSLNDNSKITKLIKNFSKWNNLKADLKDRKNRLFIFDEASMIVDVSEDNRGVIKKTVSKESQLDEIYRKINNSSGNWHILMVGDRNQLEPPVERLEKLQYSDALSKDYWNGKVSKIHHFNLTKVERTSEDSSIYKFTHAMKNNQDYMKFIDNSKVISLQDDNVASKHQVDHLKNNPSSAFFITSTNYGAYKKNKTIKKLLFNLDDEKELNTQHLEKIDSSEVSDVIVPNISEGEILNVFRNNYLSRVNLFNGDSVLVVKEPNWNSLERKHVIIPRPTDIDDNPTQGFDDIFKGIENSKLRFSDEVKNMEDKDRKNYPLYYKNSPEDFNTENWTHTPVLIKRELLFCDLEIKHLTGEDQRKIKVKIFLNTLFLPKLGNSKAVRLEEQILDTCVMQDAIERYSHLDLTEDEILEKIEEDEYVESLWAGWGYAGNANKAQGSEWPHVFVDLESAKNFSNSSSWIYTALTRAQESLTILGLDKFESLNSRDLNVEGVDDFPKSYDGRNFAPVKEVQDDKNESQDNLTEESSGVLDKLKYFIQRRKEQPFSSSDDLTQAMEELGNVLEEINQKPVKPSTSEHMLKQREKYPRHGMPWDDSEKNLLIRCIEARNKMLKYDGELKGTDKVTPELFLNTIASDMGRSEGSIGMTWLRLHLEERIDMPDELVNKYIERLNEESSTTLKSESPIEKVETPEQLNEDIGEKNEREELEKLTKDELIEKLLKKDDSELDEDFADEEEDDDGDEYEDYYDDEAPF